MQHWFTSSDVTTGSSYLYPIQGRLFWSSGGQWGTNPPSSPPPPPPPPLVQTRFSFSESTQVIFFPKSLAKAHRRWSRVQECKWKVQWYCRKRCTVHESPTRGCRKWMCNNKFIPEKTSRGVDNRHFLQYVENWETIFGLQSLN